MGRCQRRSGIGGVVVALSVTSDLTPGHPPGEAMRAGLAATELARRAGLDAADRTVVYYATLLRYAGCAPKPARASSIVERPPALPPLPADLTERELEVMRRLVVGRTKRQIAAELVISPSTVRTHTVHIYGKCGVSTRAGLAMFAMRHGLAGAPKID